MVSFDQPGVYAGRAQSLKHAVGEVFFHQKFVALGIIDGRQHQFDFVEGIQTRGSQHLFLELQFQRRDLRNFPAVFATRFHFDLIRGTVFRGQHGREVSIRFFILDKRGYIHFEGHFRPFLLAEQLENGGHDGGRLSSRGNEEMKESESKDGICGQ